MEPDGQVRIRNAVSMINMLIMFSFEWAEGFETRFGVTFVDYVNGQKRYPKKSAKAMKGLFDLLMTES